MASRLSLGARVRCQSLRLRRPLWASEIDTCATKRAAQDRARGWNGARPRGRSRCDDPLQVFAGTSRPGGKNYVRFNGKSFSVEPRELVCTTYEPGKTLPRLIPAASQYAGKEKIGVHVIAAKNPTIIDLEIAFTEPSEDGDEPRGLRIDLAALHPAENGQATLVFYEAKPTSTLRLEGAGSHTTNGDLRYVPARACRRTRRRLS